MHVSIPGPTGRPSLVGGRARGCTALMRGVHGAHAMRGVGPLLGAAPHELWSHGRATYIAVFGAESMLWRRGGQADSARPACICGCYTLRRS